MRQIFNKMDEDRSGDLDVAEFKEMFEMMKIEMKAEEVHDIFKSIDIDGSGKVEWAELQVDFENITSKTTAQLLEEARQARMTQKQIEEDEALQSIGINYSQKGGQFGYGGSAQGQSEMRQRDLERRVNSLESKLKVAYMEIKKEQHMKENLNQGLVILQKDYHELLKKFTYTRDEVFKLQADNDMHKDRERNSIPKEDSEKLQQNYRSLQIQHRETMSTLLSYKNMHGVVCEQVKSLKMILERKKDEAENLHQTVRDLASESMEKSKIDKLKYVVMLSRW